MNLFTKQNETDLGKERMAAGASMGEGIAREFRMDMYTLLLHSEKALPSAMGRPRSYV